jgi:hypothetical protein
MTQRVNFYSEAVFLDRLEPMRQSTGRLFNVPQEQEFRCTLRCIAKNRDKASQCETARTRPTKQPKVVQK